MRLFGKLPLLCERRWNRSTMSRVAAGKAVASSIDEDLAGNGLVRYRLAPPSWQAPWLLSRTAQESGYPQFFPTAIGQEEDQLTESAIKSGFIGKAVVQVGLCLSAGPRWLIDDPHAD